MAEMLNVPVSVVHEMLERSELAGVEQGGCVVYPGWQVTAEGALIPHLRKVLDAAEGLDATFLQAIMLNPSGEFRYLTPVQWLLAGLSVEPVLQRLREAKWH